MFISCISLMIFCLLLHGVSREMLNSPTLTFEPFLHFCQFTLHIARCSLVRCMCVSNCCGFLVNQHFVIIKYPSTSPVTTFVLKSVFYDGHSCFLAVPVCVMHLFPSFYFQSICIIESKVCSL